MYLQIKIICFWRNQAYFRLSTFGLIVKAYMYGSSPTLISELKVDHPPGMNRQLLQS